MSLTSRIVELRAQEPDEIRRILVERPRGVVPRDRKMMVIACDHPGRGALVSGDDQMAMASREEVLERCMEALSRPCVDGFLGTADLIEELAILGALDGKLVYGSMNRGGLMGASFEMDDRFTGYDAQGIVDAGLDGGKMLMRINLGDAATVSTIESCAQTIDALAERKVMAMVEPFISHWRDGSIVNDLSPDAVIRSIAITAALGRTSAHTWLKLPAVAEMERVMAASTMPALILGGAVGDPDESLRSWERALAIDTVKGLVIGRSLLFPPTGDVASAVDEAVELL